SKKREENPWPTRLRVGAGKFGKLLKPVSRLRNFPHPLYSVQSVVLLPTLDSRRQRGGGPLSSLAGSKKRDTRSRHARVPVRRWGHGSGAAEPDATRLRPALRADHAG